MKLKLFIIAMVLLIVPAICGQSVSQTMVNSPGGVQSGSDAICSPEGITLPKCPRVTTRWATIAGLDAQIGLRSDGAVTWRPRQKNAHAQQPATGQAQAPSLVVPIPAIQAEFAAASKAEADALRAYQTAIDNTQKVLYKAMAESGVKPSECAAGDNPFACVKSDPKGIAFERKKEVAASPAPK